jgi:hypothetical protein
MPSMPPRGGPPGLHPSGGDDSDEEEPQSFFAGGERRSIAFVMFWAHWLTEIYSGLSVQNPGRRDPQLPAHAQHVQEIMRRAAEWVPICELLARYFVFTRLLVEGLAVGLKRTKLVLALSRVLEIASVMKKRHLQPFPTRMLPLDVN